MGKGCGHSGVSMTSHFKHRPVQERSLERIAKNPEKLVPLNPGFRT